MKRGIFWTTVLAAAETGMRIPHHYFDALVLLFLRPLAECLIVMYDYTLISMSLKLQIRIISTCTEHGHKNPFYWIPA